MRYECRVGVLALLVTPQRDLRPFVAGELTRKTNSLWAGTRVPLPAAAHASGSGSSLKDHCRIVAEREPRFRWVIPNYNKNNRLDDKPYF
jgi:hypothetical protein